MTYKGYNAGFKDGQAHLISDLRERVDNKLTKISNYRKAKDYSSYLRKKFKINEKYETYNNDFIEGMKYILSFLDELEKGKD